MFSISQKGSIQLSKDSIVINKEKCENSLIILKQLNMQKAKLSEQFDRINRYKPYFKKAK
jgi:hypothetical protein